MTSWETITAAITTALSGDKETGRELLTDCWNSATEPDHAQRCVIAHYLADLQSDLAAEVAWDERALVEHPFVADEDLAPVGIATARSLAPSLHLNLGDGYRRQSRHVEARIQLDLALARVDTLPDDGYGRLIRDGLDRLAVRLEAEQP